MSCIIFCLLFTAKKDCRDLYYIFKRHTPLVSNKLSKLIAAANLALPAIIASLLLVALSYCSAAAAILFCNCRPPKTLPPELNTLHALFSLRAYSNRSAVKNIKLIQN